MKNGNQNGRTENGRYEPGHNGGAHGVPGRSGRPSDEFRESMRKIIESKPVRAAARKILKNADHPQFVALWSKCAAYAYGAPAQTVEHTGGIEINVRELSDTFTSRVDRLTQRLRTASLAGVVN